MLNAQGSIGTFTSKAARRRSVKCTPTSFFEHICESIKKEISDSVWRRKLAKQLDITETIEKLMKFEKRKEIAELTPPHEPEG